jgi:hypothetical protein
MTFPEKAHHIITATYWRQKLKILIPRFWNLILSEMTPIYIKTSTCTITNKEQQSDPIYYTLLWCTALLHLSPASANCANMVGAKTISLS